VIGLVIDLGLCRSDQDDSNQCRAAVVREEVRGGEHGNGEDDDTYEDFFVFLVLQLS